MFDRLRMEDICPVWSHPDIQKEEEEEEEEEEEDNTEEFREWKRGLMHTLLKMFQPGVVHAFVQTIRLEELSWRPLACWANELVHYWFDREGVEDKTNRTSEMLKESIDRSSREYFFRLAWPCSDIYRCHYVVREIVDDLYFGKLPMDVHFATKGSWIRNVKPWINGERICTDVYKVPPSKSAAEIVKEVRTHCLTNANRETLWFHADRPCGFDGMRLCNPSNPIAQGGDYGNGWTMYNTLQSACARIHSKKKIVGVYRDVAVRDRSDNGCVFTVKSSGAKWRRFISNIRKSDAPGVQRRVLRERGLQRFADAPWIQGPEVVYARTMANGTETDGSSMCPLRPSLERKQILIQDEEEANKWHTNLVAILVFE